MELVFLGVGEACDTERGNTSVFIRTVNNIEILFDCGFSVPHRYFQIQDNPDKLDCIWISHFHGDHFFGIPLLLLRLSEMGREKPLTFISHAEVENKIITVMETAYPNFFGKLTFPVSFKIVSAGNPLDFLDLTWQAAATDHSQYNLCLKLEDGTNSVFYSGDGRPTQASTDLAHGCDLVIHEAFKIEDSIPGHGSVQGCLDFAAQVQTSQLALVHIERHTRKHEQQRIRELIAQSQKRVLLPDDYSKITL